MIYVKLYPYGYGERKASLLPPSSCRTFTGMGVYVGGGSKSVLGDI